MPRTKSSQKNVRKSRTAAARNRAQRSTLRTALKKALGGGSSDADRTATRLLDRAARKGLIHPNKAARHKSVIARKSRSA